ncbi:MAG TPA: recombinase RecA [Firmicutes bacterium]|nr:recombinase RecA [Bacillota bacterium]
MATKKEKTNIDNMTPEERLEDCIKKIEVSFGKGAVMKLGDRITVDVGVIKSGSFQLDNALGCGGYPKGRIIEIFGPESTGKTTLALHAIAECQKAGGRAAFIDAEHAIDPEYAKTLGVNIDELILSQPDNGEQALEIANMLADSKAIDLIIVDSVAALVPKVEVEGTFEDNNIGLQARLMSRSLRKLASKLNKSLCTIIFINQIREKLAAVMAYTPGSSETTSGGRALKFYASIRIDIRRGESLKDPDGNAYGNVAIIKVVKNKVAPPFKTIRTPMIYGKGLDHVSEVCDVAIGFNLIKKSGAWFSYEDERISQGKLNAVAFLEANPDIVKKLEDQIKEKLAAGELPEMKK